MGLKLKISGPVVVLANCVGGNLWRSCCLCAVNQTGIFFCCEFVGGAHPVNTADTW